MRKFLLLFVMLFAFATKLSAQTVVVVGDSTSTNYSASLPVDCYYTDGMSQLLYYSTELQSGLITSISFYHNGSIFNDGIVKLYLKETNTSVMSSGWLPGMDWTEVFSGPVSFVPGWVTIELAAPFAYSGNANLAVGIVRDGDAFDEGHTWRTSSTSSISCTYTNIDYYEFDMMNPPVYNTTSANRPIAMFEIASLDGYCYPPAGLAVSAVEQNAATITWSSDPSSTTFGVAYKLTSDEDWTLASNTITTNSYTLTNLNSYSQYDVKVWSVCSNGNSSERRINFITLPTSDNFLQLPYVQTFDDLDSVTGWQIQNFITNAWHIGSAENNTRDEEGELTIGNALYISNDNGVTNSYSITGVDGCSYVSALIDIQEGYFYGLEFDYKCVGEPNWDELRLFLVPFDQELGAGSGEAGLPSMEYEFGYPFPSATWTRFAYVLPEVEAGVYRLVFAWINDGGTGDNPPAAIDNISIYSTNCTRPGLVSVAMEDMGENVTMTLTVENPVDGAVGYLVEYKTEHETAWSTTQSDSPIVVAGLPYGVKVQYRVSTVCAEGDQSIPTDLAEAYTICSEYTELPFAERFENEFVQADGIIGDTEAPFCWYNINGGSPDYVFYRSDFYEAASGIGTLYYSGIYSANSMEPTSDWVISPRIELSGDQRLNFQYRNASSTPGYAAPHIQVYAYDATENDITSAADTANFELLQTIYEPATASDVWTMTEINLSQFSGSIRLAIAVRQASRSFLIDDFVISNNPACPDLYGFNVVASSDESVNVTYNAANIGDAGVTLAYAQASPGDTALDLTTATLINIPQDTELPYELSGFESGSTYLFMAAQACGTEFVGPVSVTMPVVYSMPFYADFDTEETTPVVEFTTSNTNAWFIGSVINNTTDESGDLTQGGAMYISGDNGQTFGYITNGASTEAYATIPLYFEEGEALEYVISFDYKVGGEGDSYGAYDYMSAYLVPVGEIASSANALVEDLYDNAGSAWLSAEVSRGGLSGMYNLIFKWNNDGIMGSQPSVAIDNISIEGRSCAGTAVNVALGFVEDETSNTVVVNLTDEGNTGVTYNVTYPTEEGPAVITGLTLTDFPYTIVTNAEYNSPYTASVSVVCPDGGVILVGDFSITTPCQALELPWSENFASSPFGSSCWTRASAWLPSNGIISTSAMEVVDDYWSVEEIALDGTSTTAVATNIWGADYNYWLITPNINLGNDGSAKQIAFDLALTPWGSTGVPQNAYDDRLIVFVSTDGGLTWNADNALVFANGDADEAHNFADLTNSFQRYAFKLVDADDEPITGSVRFAFYAESTEGNGDNFLYIDNILVEEWSECQRPYNLNVSNITQTTATASFSVFATTEWEYTIVAGTDPSSGTAIAVENPSNIELTNLIPGTTYTFAARSTCGEANSDWATYQFNTVAQPTAVPYTTSFNTNDSWFMADGSHVSTPNAWAIGNATSIDGQGAAYISNDGGQSYAATAGAMQTITHLYKDFDFGQTEDVYEMAFDWKSIGANINVYLTTITDLPQTGMIGDIAKIAEVSSAEDWQTKRIYLGNILGPKRLIFTAVGYTEATNTPATIDNLSISVISCAPPAMTSVQATNITANSATITWNDPETTHNLWTVYYKKNTDTEYTFVTTTQPTLDLTNLEASTNYDVYVTTMCGSEESVGTTLMTFSTECGIVASYPYFESFENQGDFGCWTTEIISGTTLWDIVMYQTNEGQSVMASDGNYMAYHTWNNGESSRLISPVFDLTNLESPTIKYDYQLLGDQGTHENLTVKYRQSESSEWVTLRNYTATTPTWVTDSILLPEPSASYQISFESIGVYGYGVVVDAFHLYDSDGESSGGDDPEVEPCDAPTDLAAINITQNTADITWNGTASNYEIQLNNMATETISQTTHHYTDLPANTTFTVKVRAVCEGQTSSWVSVQFTTLEQPGEEIVAPTVETLEATNITTSSATMNGVVTPGSEEIVARGIIYKADSELSWHTMITPDNNISITVDSLETEMVYQYKAFVVTASGRLDGETLTFTTLAGLNDATANAISATIYPNPAHDKAIISVSVAGAKMVVSDMQGRILLSDDMNESTYELNTSNYAAGVYYIRIISGNNVNTQKLIVK